MCVLMIVISYVVFFVLLVSKLVIKFYDGKIIIFCWKSIYNIDGINFEMYLWLDNISNVIDSVEY